jgi:hypothetical protein
MNRRIATCRNTLEKFRLRILAFLFLVPIFVQNSFAVQDSTPKIEKDIGRAKTFVNKYCVSCHGPTNQEGDRRFDQLASSEFPAEQSETWHEVLDRLNLGDMPPDDAPLQPSDEERLELVAAMTRILTSTANESRKPQTVFRRLNHYEYDATMRSLLGLEKMLENPIDEFTPDAKTDHFSNIGETLVLSDFLLTRYLEASERYFQNLRGLAAQPTNKKTWTFNAPFCRNMPNPDGLDRDGEYQHIRENATDNFGYLWLKKLRKGVPASGEYRIRIKAAAINRDHPFKDWIINVPREDALQLSIVAGDTRAGDMATNNPTDRRLAVMDIADDEAQWYETTAWLDKHFQPRLGYPNGPVRIKFMRHLLMHNHRDIFAGFIKDRIHIFHSMHPDFDRETAPALEKKFLEEQEQLKQAGKPYAVFGKAHSIHTDEAWRQFYTEYQGPRIRVFEVQIEGPLQTETEKEVASIFPSEQVDDATANELIRSFATQAFRRPVLLDELAAVTKLYRDQIKTHSQHDALQVAYQAIVCSPSFLYHRTKAGPLDDFELANRLAYFLWSSPPDAELLKLASKNLLREPKTLNEQVERLLDDPKSENMVAQFTDAWLQLSKLGTMLPDRVEHPEYYNQRLEEAMRTETRIFIQDAISRDLDLSVLVNGKHTFVNSSLARLYNLDGVEGHEFRRVKLTDENRGGLLGQASVLTASANGIDTSPVLRGVWVMECLLGTPPSPPPPDVEPLEPDTRGTTTIREQLAKHRDVATCNNCHRRIDPPGFALESFDEIGNFRTHYLLPGYGKKKGSKIDASGKLASGESFQDVKELRALLLNRMDVVARNVATKLLVHATGRIDDHQDRADVIKLMEKAGNPSELGFRTLIHSVVQSEAFRR